MFKVLIPNSSQNSSVEGESWKDAKQEAAGFFYIRTDTEQLYAYPLPQKMLPTVCFFLEKEPQCYGFITETLN